MWPFSIGEQHGDAAYQAAQNQAKTFCQIRLPPTSAYLLLGYFIRE